MMIILILSLLPSIGLYYWLRNLKGKDVNYRLICSKALKSGLLFCTLFVFILSSLCYIPEIFMKYLGINSIVIAAYHNYVLFACSEEIIKYLMVKKVIQKNSYSYSRLDLIILMMIVGLGFGLTEALLYSIGASVGMMVVRGLTLMHAGYGFIMGYFISKEMQTNDIKYRVMSLLVPIVLHGTYDFCLSNELALVSENFAFISLFLAVVALIIIVVAIIFIQKNKCKLEYTEKVI